MVPWADAAIEYAAFDPQSDMDALMAQLTEMGMYAIEHIQRLREQPADDSVLSQVVHATIPDGRGGQRQLDDLELVRFFNLLITGGLETTRNAIAGGYHALLSHPEQLEALAQGDEALFKNAVDEILRYTSPVHFNRRTASEDVVFHGHLIKRGDKVTVWYPSANRDAEVFVDPDRFDIHRTNPGKHIAFGYGIHHCLGAALARMEIRIMLETLLTRWRGREVQACGPLRFIRSNRHQGVAEMNIRIQF
jgi:cytochrome P450